MKDALKEEALKGIPGVVKKLAGDLCLAYIAEHMAKTDAQMAADRAEVWKAGRLHTAYREGVIGGKGTNAETRRQQEIVFLAAMPNYRNLLACQTTLELHAITAAAERKGLEATISLTKAWWHTGAASEEPG